MKMKRTQISLTDEQFKDVIKHTELTGMSMSELIRRLIDKWKREKLME